jgi:hypothetical protein
MSNTGMIDRFRLEAGGNEQFDLWTTGRSRDRINDLETKLPDSSTPRCAEHKTDSTHKDVLGKHRVPNASLVRTTLDASPAQGPVCVSPSRQ